MFRRFMYGRYGNDQLNNAIIILSLVFGFAAIFVGGALDLAFSLLQLILLAVWALRAFSRKHNARYRENQKFMVFWNKLKPYFRNVSAFFNRLKDRRHKYFKCPKCKSRLRVPRGRGNITVTCPRCGNRFDKKS